MHILRCGLTQVELHVHLDGAFDELVMFAEAKALQASGRAHNFLPENVTLFGETYPVRRAVEGCSSGQDFKRLASCKGKRSLHAMFRCFEIFLPIVRGRLPLIEELAFRFVERQAAQSVVYTEVRYSPHLLADGGLMVLQTDDMEGSPRPVDSDDEEEETALPPVPMSEHASAASARAAVDAEAVYQAVTRGLRRGQLRFGVTVNQILCMLAFRPDWALDTVRMANAHRKHGPCAVVGVDVAGGEEWFKRPAVPEGEIGMHGAHVRALAKAQELKLNVTLHAGEDTDASNVGAAVFEHGAMRIGHGYHLVDDPGLLARCVAKGVHFECCPTSSFETGGWSGESSERMDWSSHPLKSLLAAGASVGLNSDDPAVFATSLTDELLLAATPAARHGRQGAEKAWSAGAGGLPPSSGVGLRYDELVKATLDAADAAFVPRAERAALRASLEARFMALEKVRGSAL